MIMCSFALHACIIRSLIVTLIALVSTKVLKINPNWACVMEAICVVIYHKINMYHYHKKSEEALKDFRKKKHPDTS